MQYPCIAQLTPRLMRAAYFQAEVAGSHQLNGCTLLLLNGSIKITMVLLLMQKCKACTSTAAIAPAAALMQLSPLF